MKHFEGKVATVTGAGSGIGRALARELALSGARVAVTDRLQERIDQVVRELAGLGAEARGYLVDHANKTMVETFSKKVLNDFGRVDVLCLNAGVGIGGLVEEYTLDDWEWLLGNNLWSVIYMIHHFVPTLIRQGRGEILITASAAGLLGMPGILPYSTAKFGLVGLSESLRMELSRHNITVSVLCPGVIRTGIVNDARMHMKDFGGPDFSVRMQELFQKRGLDPSRVARKALRRLARGRAVTTIPSYVWFLWLLKRLCPFLYDFGFRFLWRKGWVL